MAKSGRSHEALQQLLDERKRYEQWIATLESRRESTPEHVYKRVHADYEQRLGGVRDLLNERTGEIKSTIAELKERLREVTEQETARVDELHEAELRAVVGEFTPEQWELRKREVEVDLKRFVDEKKKISDELNQLLLIIEQTTENGAGEQPPERTPAPPPQAPAPPPQAPVAPDATRVRSRTPARSRAAIPDTPPPAAEEEKATVTIESLAPADGPPAQVSERDKPPDVPPAAAAAPEAPTPAAGATPAAPPAETPPARASDPAEPKPEPARANSHGKRAKTGTFAPAPADARRENEKTLKCAECGAMNYPTEWYCESCGGELSAL